MSYGAAKVVKDVRRTRKAVGVLQWSMFESFHDELRSLLCLLALLR